MQHLIATELGMVRSGIAAACYERMRVQKEQHKFRHCLQDERHAQWGKELCEIETRRAELLQQQAAILKESIKNGVGVKRLRI
jgi:hypothetical protein